MALFFITPPANRKTPKMHPAWILSTLFDMLASVPGNTENLRKQFDLQFFVVITILPISSIGRVRPSVMAGGSYAQIYRVFHTLPAILQSRTLVDP